MDELADVFEYFEPENSAEYLKETDLGKTVLLIGKMETDAAADVLREFPKEKRNQLFELLTRSSGESWSLSCHLTTMRSAAE